MEKGRRKATGCFWVKGRSRVRSRIFGLFRRSPWSGRGSCFRHACGGSALCGGLLSLRKRCVLIGI